MSTHYCLRVIRLEELKWKHPLHRNDPNLYVEVRFGGATRKTQVAKRSESPNWDEELVFPEAEETAKFEIKVMYDRSLPFLPDSCIGVVDVQPNDLLADSAKDKVPLEVLSPKRKARITGRIILRLTVKNIIEAADTGIRGAVQDTQRLKIAQLEGTSDLVQSADGGAAQAGGQHKLYKAANELLQRLEKLENVIGAVSEMSPFSKIAWSLASTLLKTVQNVFEADKKVVELVQAMGEAFDFVRDVQTLQDKATMLQRPIEGLLKQTIECCIFVREYTSHGFAGRMHEFDSSQKINEFEESLVKFKKEIDSGVILHTAFVSVRATQGIDKLLLQQQLNPTHFDAFDRPSCLPKTRLEIRKRIIEWMFSETTQNVFWLYGVAGSGKSTISATIAQHFRDMSRLGAFLFFERGKSEPSSVIRTIAYKLGIFDSSIGSNILSAITGDQDIATATAIHQFNKLLLEPLVASASSTSGPIVIVLDALDESGTLDSRRNLMKLLQNEIPKLPNNFRFLITSRQEADIDGVLRSRPESVCATSLNHTSLDSQHDVLSYICTEMDDVRTQLGIPKDRAWNDKMIVLGKAAGGLFIWASTVVKLVQNSDDTLYCLNSFISNLQSVSELGLYDLYSTVLKSSGIDWTKSRSRDRFRKVFSLLLLSKVLLSSETIDGVIGFRTEESSVLILSRLRSLITYSPGGPVSLLHTSFSDYLMSTDRLNEPWFIDPPKAHGLITGRCFIVMGELLRFNICGLKSSFVRNDDVPGLADRIKSQIPSHLEYACLHWAQHLCDSRYCSELLEKLSDFAYRRVLFWFEVLSLVKAFGRVASSALHSVSSWVEPHDTSLAPFLQDASRLASTFSVPIMQSTPHIYISLLPFPVGDSEFVARYSKYMTSMVRVELKGVKRPPLYLKVLEGQSDWVTSVAFSPNRMHVLSACDDGTALVRDIDSGEVVCGPLEGTTACFSPDGICIVSASKDGTVRVWSARDGSLVLGPLEGHTSRVNSVAWSPDGTRIASDSFDKTIIIWDAADGRAIFRLTGHTNEVNSVAFSPDSARLASGSDDNTIRIWDVNNGVLAFGPFEGHSDVIRSVAYSPNGKHVISGSDDDTIKIWDVESGSVISTLKAHIDWVMSVAYSLCGSYIVSASADKTIIVWDAKSGNIASGPFEGHTDFVNSVAYSPDGKYIASGSDDKTVRIWDASVKAISSESSQKHEGPIRSVAFSPDGRRIASASVDGSIIVWDAQTEDVIAGPFLGDTGRVICVAFLPDGLRLVSGSKDKTIRIWGAGSCEVVCGPLEGELTDNTCVAVSPDGMTIVFGPIDEAMRVWSIAGDNFVAGPSLFHKKCVDSVAFSRSGKQFVSGSGSTIKVWNTETWEGTSEFSINQSESLSSICFSPDDTQIACIVDWESIIILDAVNGSITAGPFEGSNSKVYCVLFSRGGEYIISGSYEAIRISDAENGETIFDLKGNMSAVLILALSPDGSRLVSGSFDNTVRLWDVSDLLRHPAEISSTSATTLSSSSRVISDWVLGDNGWIVGGPDGRDLLLWVPPDLRQTLCQPRCLSVLSCDFSTKLDFTCASLGERWTDCFTSPE